MALTNARKKSIEITFKKFTNQWAWVFRYLYVELGNFKCGGWKKSYGQLKFHVCNEFKELWESDIWAWWIPFTIFWTWEVWVWGEKNDMVNQSSFVLWSQKTFRRWHCLMIFRVEVINIILNNISSFGLEEKALFQWGCQVCCASSKQVEV